MSTSIVGSCGEHFVAAYLSGHGLIVALPRAGVRGADLFVSEVAVGPPMRVQVKTARSASGKYKKELIHSWDTSLSVIECHDESLWYAYVNLKGWPGAQQLPEVFFVPSDTVVKCMEPQHAKKVKRSFFWMPDMELEKHRGDKGVALLRGAMKPKA